jgi:glycine/D-amino acid oxidase-like deaminating enzyme
MLNADTLRNHAWLQSGLLYAKSNFEAARTLSEWGKRMLIEFGYLVPEVRGVFRFSDDGGESEREFKDRVERLQLSHDVIRMSQDEARNALGMFFLPGFIHYLVPDTPFDEAFLLHVARQRAMARRMHLRKARISLIKRADSNQGFVIQVNDRDILESRYTVLCAGAGLPRLLEQLGLTHELAVFRSALLRIDNGNVLRVPLLVDISEGLPTSGLSVIQHDPKTVAPKAQNRVLR